jgi:transposase
MQAIRLKMSGKTLASGSQAVPERLEGAPRQFRRRWSDEFKERAVAEAMEPGASVSAIAHRIGIHPSQLFGWRRDARAGQRSLSQDPAVQGRLARER